MKITVNQYMYKKNISVRQASMLTGIPKSTIHDVINAKSSPTMETMERLAAGLKTKISNLYESDFK